MQLNHECIRDILLFIEDNTPRIDSKVYLPDIRDGVTYPVDEVDYHITKIVEGGFVEPRLFDSNGAYLETLTFIGHEYLDNIRDKSAWSKLKESGLSSMSLDVTKDLAKDIITSLAKKKLGLE